MKKALTKVQYDHLVIAAAILVGFVSGTHQLSDNSMFVHLRTGMSILRTHHVPHSDPYSFTAHGKPWVDESWLPELIYGICLKIGGGHLLQLFNAVLFGACAGVIAKLARANNIWSTLLSTFISIGMGYFLWTTRPTMFGLLFFALTVLVVNRKAHFMWLVPIGLVWVNSHASWPVGVAWILLTGIGARFDREQTDSYIKYLGAFVGSCLVGGLVSPAGWHILSFPAVGFGSKSAVFQSIAEWKSPNFGAMGIEDGRVVLVCFIVMVIVFTRRKLTWSQLLPVLMLIASALLGVRNLIVLGAGVAPVLGVSLQRPSKLVDASVRRIIAYGMIAFTICGALDLVPTYSKSAYDFGGYPVNAITWLDGQGLIGPGHQVAEPDFVGCYLILKYGDKAANFIDDRYDMYPLQVSNDSFDLDRVTDAAPEVLAKYDIQAVVFARTSATANFLRIDPAWKEVWADPKWMVFEPVSAPA